MDTKAAFEKWIKSDFNLEITMRCDMTKGIAWAAWQASRAEIEIELPELCDCCYTEPENFIHEEWIEEVGKAITSHGIRIKGKTE